MPNPGRFHLTQLKSSFWLLISLDTDYGRSLVYLATLIETWKRIINLFRKDPTMKKRREQSNGNAIT
jgi:hypothetical protein